MAVICEIPGDSNDGGANKNPRDESKKPQEQQVAKTRRGTCNPLPFLPDELLERIIVLASIWEYPKLSLVSSKFRLFIAWPQLYDERLKMGNTETLIGFPPSWYILNKTDASFRLKRIESLGKMPYGSAVVTIGFNMYVIGGCVGCVSQPYGSAVSLIDCRFHKSRSLPSMRTARYRALAGVIDGKIYVIGGCEKGATHDWIEVFDVKTQVWSPVTGPYDADGFLETSAVIKDKIYVLDNHSCITYEPKKDIWERLLVTGTSLWQQCSCVVDDVLFTIDHHTSRGYPVLAFDPKENSWRTVTILGPFPMPDLLYFHAKMANLGGNLVILGSKESHNEIWCIEITLERLENGHFSGTIVTVERVLAYLDAPYIAHILAGPFIKHCRAVTV